MKLNGCNNNFLVQAELRGITWSMLQVLRVYLYLIIEGLQLKMSSDFSGHFQQAF